MNSFRKTYLLSGASVGAMIPQISQQQQAPAAAATKPTPAQANIMARQMIVGSAIEMRQQVFGQTYTTPATGQIYNIPIRNIGLVKKLVVEVVAQVRQGAAETQTLTKWGPANIFSNVQVTDLSNQQRINTSGWHLHTIASMKAPGSFCNGAAFTNDSPINFGANFNVIKANASVTTVVPMYMVYEIPLAYSDMDLRGAIWASVVNATMNLQLTLNPAFWIASGADATLGVYQSSTAQLGVINSMTINVYQVYLDQLPQTPQGPLLPLLDLSTAYMLNNTAVAALTAGQDNPINYANFRSFLSTFVIYDNQGLNAGTDINYFALQSANYTNIFKYDVQMAAYQTRRVLQDDTPTGSYYFDHRARPLETIQYGNLQLIVNPSSVAGAASQLLVGFEALAIINQVTQAGSLYAT